MYCQCTKWIFNFKLSNPHFPDGTLSSITLGQQLFVHLYLVLEWVQSALRH